MRRLNKMNTELKPWTRSVTPTFQLGNFCTKRGIETVKLPNSNWRRTCVLTALGILTVFALEVGLSCDEERHRPQPTPQMEQSVPVMPKNRYDAPSEKREYSTQEIYLT